MRLLSAFALALALAAPAAAQTPTPDAACNPLCVNQPATCCLGPQADTFLAEQCTGITSDRVHFVVTNGTAWVDQRSPATFNVSGTSGSIILGDVMPVTVGFRIGNSTASARFQVIDDSLPITVLGQCVGMNGNTYTGLPTAISVDGRGLLILKQNPLYCRATGFPDLFCLEVRGQVGPPFQAQQLCSPDRVEYICGEVQ
jgi:hypothetical protein